MCSSLCLCENILISPLSNDGLAGHSRLTITFSWIKKKGFYLLDFFMVAEKSLSIIYIPLKIIFLLSLYLQLSLSLMFRNFGKMDVDLFLLILCNLLYLFSPLLLTQILFINFENSVMITIALFMGSVSLRAISCLSWFILKLRMVDSCNLIFLDSLLYVCNNFNMIILSSLKSWSINCSS